MKKTLAVLLLAVVAISVGAFVGMSDVQAKKQVCPRVCEYNDDMEDCYWYYCCPGTTGCYWDFSIRCRCPIY